MKRKISDVWEDIVRDATERRPALGGFLVVSRPRPVPGEMRIEVEVMGDFTASSLEERGAGGIISSIIEKRTGERLEVTFTPGDFSGFIEETTSRRAREEKRRRIESIRKSSAAVGGRVLMGSGRISDPIRIRDIIGARRNLVIEGEIFDLYLKARPGRKTIFSFIISDKSDSICVKVFEPPAPMTALKEGTSIRMRGSTKFDRFEPEELIFTPRDAVVTERRGRTDGAPVKRVELHLHTKATRMDGLVEPDRLFPLLSSWSVPAVAITDRNVLHSLPRAYKSAKASGVRLIPGIEFNLVDDEVRIVSDPDERDLSGPFVVLDLETTGLSAFTNEIIEVAAYRLEGGKVTDRYSSFVRPERKISSETKGITGITGADLSKAPGRKEVVRQLRRFIEGAAIVAHNASFDCGFLRKAFGHLWKTVPVIDTLALARALYPDLGSYKLAKLAKRFGVPNPSLHRAENDVRVLVGLLDPFMRTAAGMGAETLLDLASLSKRIEPRRLPPYSAVALARDSVGMRNLNHLVTKAHIEHFHREPKVPASILESLREGLLIGSSALGGEVMEKILDGAGDDELTAAARRYDYIEIAPKGAYEEILSDKRIGSLEAVGDLHGEVIRIAKRAKRPVVAVGDVRHIEPEEVIFRRILRYGERGGRGERIANLFLRTTNEMLEEFEHLGKETAREIVIDEPNRIVGMMEETPILPEGFHPPEMENAAEILEEAVMTRARELYGDDPPLAVKGRIKRELDAIVSGGFSVLYLLSKELVEISRKEGYVVGSRGSVGSSLVAYLTGISEVNPLPPHYRCPACRTVEFREEESSGPDLPRETCPECGSELERAGFKIPFEAFMGMDGTKVPDIDLNFSGEYQEKAMKYIEERFGKGQVFRAGTVMTLARKTAYELVARYSREHAFSPRKAELERLIRGILDVGRTTGRHPGGIVIVPRGKEITDFMPVQYPADASARDTLTTHYDFHAFEGTLVKVDVLGHDMPTALRLLTDLTGVNAEEVPIDDPDVMALFSSTRPLGLSPRAIGSEVGTLGIPEFGTELVRSILVQTRPGTIEELVRISGISHGEQVWKRNAQDLIRDGTASLKEVIATREDIMNGLVSRKIPPVRAYAIMERVRKGKGLAASDEAELAAARVDPWMIESLKKIRYLFPRAHATAYVLMSLRMAYFKVHHPEAFYAVYFTLKVDDIDIETILKGEAAVVNAMGEIRSRGREATVKDTSRLVVFEVAREMLARGIGILSPSLTSSDPLRFILEEGALRSPLTAMTGLGRKVAERISSAGKEEPFSSIEDLITRTALPRPVAFKLKRLGGLRGLPDSDQMALFA